MARAMRKNHTERFPSIEEFVQTLTGEALAQTRSVRKPAVTAPDAMAMTVDSGNHGPAFGAANTTPAPQPTPYPAQSVRTAPAALSNSVAPMVVTLSSLAPGAGPAVTPMATAVLAAPRKRVPLFVFAAAGLACAAVIGGLVVARTRHPATPTPVAVPVLRPDAVQIAIALDAAPPPPTDAASMVQPDASPAPMHDAAPAAKRTDARPNKPPTPMTKTTTETPSTTQTDEPNRDAIRQTLRQAVQAVASGNYDTAKSHALRVIDAPDVKPGQRNQAIAVMVTIECENGQLGRANDWFRQLKAPLRKGIKKHCADKGTDLN